MYSNCYALSFIFKFIFLFLGFSHKNMSNGLKV